MFRYFCIYDSNKQIIEVEHKEDLIGKIKADFDIPSDNELTIQLYDNEFEDWANIADVENLPPKAKLLITTIGDPLPQLLSSLTNSPLSYSVLSTDMSTTSVSDDGDYNCPSLNEVAGPSKKSDEDVFVVPIPTNDASSSQAELCERRYLKPWPQHYELPKFPSHIVKEIGSAKPTKKVKRQIIQLLFDDMFQYVRYPTSHQYNEVSHALISKFPLLGEEYPLGNKWDGWKNRLSDKFRNERKHFEGRKSPPAKKMKKDFVEYEDGETPDTMEHHKNWLIAEYGKKKPNMEKVAKLMNLTYRSRRQFVLSGPSIHMLRTQYPFLFSRDEIISELCRITQQKECRTRMKERFLQYFQSVMSFSYDEDDEEFVRKAQQVIEEEENEEQKEALQFAAVMWLLPSVCGSKRDIFLQDKQSVVQSKVIKLLIAYTGDFLLSQDFHIFCEGETICTLDNHADAMIVYFGSFYVFDMKYNSGCFLPFVQTVIMEMKNNNNNQKLPRKLSLVLQALQVPVLKLK